MTSKQPSPPSTRGLTIVHSASLLPEDRPAFEHAVALARHSASTLVSVHADGGVGARERMPRAVDTLVSWGALERGAAEGDEAKLGMRHDRVAHDCCEEDPVDTLLDALRNTKTDLLVATTTAKSTVARLFFGSVAEGFALELHVPSLLLPVDCRPLVTAKGEPRLARIVVAAGDPEACAIGVERALWLADVLGAGALDVDLVRAGAEGEAPSPPPLPARPDTRFRVLTVPGSVEDAIVGNAERAEADLIVMATRGHDSVRDMITGSHTERVLRRASCPVLSIPVR